MLGKTKRGVNLSRVADGADGPTVGAWAGALGLGLGPGLALELGLGPGSALARARIGARAGAGGVAGVDALALSVRLMSVAGEFTGR